MKENKIFFLPVFLLLIISSCTLSGQKESSVKKWGIFESELTSVKLYDNPVRDVDLLIKIERPDGSVLSHYGFFDGNNTWRFRIMPDMEGIWRYNCHFSDSSRSITGQFRCSGSEKRGPLSVDRKNPYWIKTKDSPPRQLRSFHAGDRFFASNWDNEERIRFLDWITDRGYNMVSVASHYLNRKQNGRGKGWNTPKLWPIDPDEYSKLEKFLSDLEQRDIYVYPFAGFFGRSADWPVNHSDQELYIKYTLARLGSFRNLILNVAGPEPILKPEDYQGGHMKMEDINRLAGLIKKYDTYGHLLSVHNRTNNEKKEYEYDPFIFEEWEDFATLQGGKSGDLKDVYNFVLESRKVIKPVYAQEVLWYGNMYHASLDIETLRKKAITLIMAGSFINFGDMNGNSSSGFSGCLNPDSANVEAHTAIKKVWDLFDQVPFSELSPRPDLVSGALCLSDGKGKYLIYSSEGLPFTINSEISSTGKWINPRTDSQGKKSHSVSGSLITPPDRNDWFLFIEN